MLPVLARQAREQSALGDRIRDLVVDDELVLGVHGHLDVALCQDGIAHVGDPAATDGHGAGVRIGEGDLGLVALFDAPLQALVVLHALFQEPDLLFQLLGGELAFFGLLGVVGIQLVQVGFDLPCPGQDRLVDLFEGPLQLAIGEVALAGVDGLELTPFGDRLPSMATRSRLKRSRSLQKAVKALHTSWMALRLCLRKLAMVLPKVLAREVRSQLTGQPHDFRVAVGFALQGAAACPSRRPGDRMRLR